MRSARMFVVVGVLVGVVGPARAAAPPPVYHPLTPIGSMESGTAEYVDGAFVWTDYAYDDVRSASPNNTADLIQVQVSADDEDVVVRAILETLVDPLLPRFAIAFDTDRDASTGAASLKSFSDFGRAPIGVERTIVARAEGGEVYGESIDTDPIGIASVGIDPADNAIEVIVPRALVDPGRSTWRVYAALGVSGNDATGDVAFIGGEAPNGWQNAKQAAFLGGSGTAHVDIDFGAIAERVSVRADPTTPGFHTFVYRSDLRLGEGIRQNTIRAPGGSTVPLGSLYAGPYQPYLVWIARSLPVDPPLIVFMHGLNGTHTSSAGSFGPARPPAQPQDVFLGAGGFEPRAVVAMPLGRGEQSFFLGAGEQDVLDVADDARARYGADPDRVVLSGVSMGGFGAFRLGIVRPDRWSAIVPLIGTARSAQALMYPLAPAADLNASFSPSAFPSGAGEMMENLLNVPVRMVNGQVDPIVNDAFAAQDAAWLTQLGYDHKAWVLHRRQHEIVPAITNCVLEEAIAMRRAAAPGRIVFSVEPDTFVHDEATGLDLKHDRAYWVSDIRLRARATKGTVVAESMMARAHVMPATPFAAIAPAGGMDLCENEDASATDPWRATGVVRAISPAPSMRNGLDVAFTNVAAATFNVARAGIDVSRLFTIEATGDGPTTLTLYAPWPGRLEVLVGSDSLGVFSPEDDVIMFTADLAVPRTITILPAE